MEDAEDILESKEAVVKQENTHENRDDVKKLQADISFYFLKFSA